MFVSGFGVASYTVEPANNVPAIRKLIMFTTGFHLLWVDSLLPFHLTESRGSFAECVERWVRICGCAQPMTGRPLARHHTEQRVSSTPCTKWPAVCRCVFSATGMAGLAINVSFAGHFKEITAK
jgi:hypothetical protein